MPPQSLSTSIVVASPAGAAETVIAKLGGVSSSSPSNVWRLTGWCDTSVAAAGTAMTLNVRRDNIAGTVVATSTYTFKGAGDVARIEATVGGTDSPGQVNMANYVLTLTVPSGATASTIHGVLLTADSYS